MDESTGAMPDPATLVERAIESVLDQVPDLPDFEAPDGGRIQPWADVSAPQGKNKRPLEELVAEYAERVAAAPDARAHVPADKSAAEVFFDKLAPGGAPRPGKAKRRRRGRGRPGAPESPAPVVTPPPAAPQAGSPARRRRRGRGRRGRGTGGGGGAPAAQ